MIERRFAPRRREPGRRASPLLLLLLLGLLSARLTGSAEAAVEILTPNSENVIFARHPETHLVVRQSGKSPVWVEMEGKRLEPLLRGERQGNTYLHFRLPLKPDLNVFSVFPGDQPLVLRYRPLRATLNPNAIGKDVYLFHQGDQLPPSCTGCHDLQKSSPLGTTGLRSQDGCASCHRNVVDKSLQRHSTTVQRQCLTCHQQYIKPWRIGFPTGNVEEACLTCHTGKKDWGSRSSVHGPMVAGGCTLCHNPHGEANRYQLWADSRVELCITCHGDKENLVSKEKPLRYVHGIIHGPGCVACHDPHATDHESILHQPINDLCVSCHQRFAGLKRGHPVGGHPVSGPNERRRPGRELTCASCHDPHGSPYRSLLFADSVGGYVCSKCHR
ncbi:MAG: cytochrome c3 family protein [Desulfuromonadales bacterium]|nr:cytochrome c3 family protein [Desulfuromonadales bacterium]